MKLYEINNCNASLMSDYIYIEASTAVEAVYKKFNVITQRSSDKHVDYIVTPVEYAGNGRYYKRGNQIGLCKKKGG